LNHTVLDRVEDDRTALLIKLKNSTMISTAYETAARGEKQNCSFLKERDIVVYDRAVLEEYKYFKQSEDKLPSCFAILTKSPQYYEVLYDVELVIYVRSSDAVLQKIQENIFNLTAIGRSEDFVDVISCEEAELEQSGEWQEKRYSMYISRELVDKEIIVLGNAVENMANGTMYALDKDYVIENKKRKFNKKWAFYTENYSVDEESWDYEGTDLYFDKKHNNIVNFM
jgi:CRISPR-associated protein Cas5t